jgi:hypothetical protein
LITYRVRLDVPRELVLYVSRLLARRRRQIGTRKGTRCLGCYRQALLVLAWYRDKPDIARLGAGSGLSQATSYRYLAEGTEVLSAQVPGLEEALERAVAEGTPYVILDGKIVDSDRCHEKTVSRKGRDIDLWYSGKKKDFGGNVQALFYPGGLPMWVSDVLPGNVHDLAAARENVLPVLREYTDTMPCLADRSVKRQSDSGTPPAGYRGDPVSRGTLGRSGERATFSPAGRSAFGLISSVVAVSQSAANKRLPAISVGWCSPRYMRESAMRAGMAIAGMRKSHRHQPRAWPMTRIARAT